MSTQWRRSSEILPSRTLGDRQDTGSNVVVAFALAYAFFIIGPALLSFPFTSGPVPGVGDLLDLATPFVLLTLYYVMYHHVTTGDAGSPVSMSRRPIAIAFLLSSVLFVQGQGMHLSANSIGHFLNGMERTDAGAITYFYDEVLSHYIWYAGALGLAMTITLAGVRSAAGIHHRHVRGDVRHLADVGAALLYGLTFAMATIESQTVPLGLPISALLSGAVLICKWRQDLAVTSLSTFFGLGHGFAALLILAWGIYFRGFPEFSALGMM